MYALQGHVSHSDDCALTQPLGEIASMDDPRSMIRSELRLLLAATIALAACAAQAEGGAGKWPSTVAAGEALPFPTPFDRVGSYVATTDSTGFVADPTARRLVAINWADGTIRDLVRDGDGPGEVRGVAQLVASPDGAVLLDPRKRQVMRIGLDGAVVDELRMDSLPLGAALRAAGSSGALYFEWRGIRRAGAPDSAYILRWIAGAPVDTVGRTLAAPMHNITITRGTSRNTMMFSAPYASLDLWAASIDGRLAILRSDPVQLETTSRAGTRSIGPMLAPPQRALTQTDRDSASIPDELRAEVVWPEVLPPFNGHLLWCQNSDLLLAPREMGSGSSPSILLLEATGEPRGVVMLSRQERIVGCDATHVYSALPDTDGLEQLIRRPLGI